MNDRVNHNHGLDSVVDKVVNSAGFDWLLYSVKVHALERALSETRTSSILPLKGY